MALPLLMLAGMGAQVGGGLLGAYGAYDAAGDEAGALKYNAKLRRMQAAQYADTAKVESGMAREDARRMQAEQKAIASKMGADISAGTPLVVLSEQAGIMEENILQHRRNRLIEEQGMMHEAAMMDWEAKAIKSAAKMNLYGSLLGLGGSLGLQAGSMFGGSGSPKTKTRPTSPVRMNLMPPRYGGNR